MAELFANFAAATEPAAAQELYNNIFLNEEVVVELMRRSPDDIVGFVTKALTLFPTWTTTRAAVKLQGLTNLVYLGAKPKDFNSVWLYSLAVAAETDPGNTVVLSDKQAEMAFALADVWATLAGRPRRRTAAAAGPGDAVMADAAGRAQATKAEEEDSEDGGAGSPLAWEDSREPLPHDLQQVATASSYRR